MCHLALARPCPLPGFANVTTLQNSLPFPLSQVHILLSQNDHHFLQWLISVRVQHCAIIAQTRHPLSVDEHMSLKPLYHPTVSKQKKGEKKTTVEDENING